MNKKKRILILSSDAGFGHRSTALAIAAALEEKYGDRCQYTVVNPFDAPCVPKFLQRTQHDYDRIVREWPALYRLGYQANEQAPIGILLSSSLILLLYRGMQRILETHQPDAIVVTFPLYQPVLHACFSIQKKTIPTITVVTDLAEVHRLWFHKVASACMVATERVAKVAQRWGINSQKIHISGLPVNPKFAHPSKNKAVSRQAVGWVQDTTTILVVGSKRVGKLAEFLRPLNHANLPLQLAIVAGGDDATYNKLQQTTWHLPTHLYNFVDNMPELMQAADCIVCKAGGLIVTESLACGLPQLIIDAIPGQETGNLDYILSGEAAVYTQDPMSLLETIYHWLAEDGRLLKQYSKNAMLLGRPFAAYKVATLTWKAAHQSPNSIIPVRQRLKISSRFRSYVNKS